MALRTRDLAGAHARLAMLDRAKSDFLRLISHEVRTPLNGIVGAFELLLDFCGENPTTAQFADIFQDSWRRLMTLVDDALLLTQIGSGSGRDDDSARPLSELLDQAHALALPQAQARGVDLAPVPPGLDAVLGLPEHLIRALQALLETAAKFARAGTTVQLTPVTTPTEVSLTIDAEGHTLPPHVVPRFFDLLAVTEPLTAADDLGLAPPLAEKIVTLYGGAVSVANLDPPGLRLTVRLKCAAANGPHCSSAL